MNNPLPRCRFYVRRLITEQPLAYSYDQGTIRTPHGSLQLRYPPSIGDLILLIGESETTKGMFRVMDRAWMHAQYGSADWPFGNEPQSGPIVDLIVEPAEGPFVNEAD